MTWECHLCHESIEAVVDPLEDVVEHLRVAHPDDYGDGFERWSDGSLVIHADESAMSVETMLEMGRE